MSRIYLLVAVVVTIGIALLTVSYAAGAPPDKPTPIPTPQTVTGAALPKPTPTPQGVREQNLDPNGYIRVALPLDAQGNLKVSSSAPISKTLATGLSVPSNGFARTTFTDVRGCSKFGVFTEGGTGLPGTVMTYLVPSWDGITGYGRFDNVRSTEGSNRYTNFPELTAPYIAVDVYQLDPENPATITVNVRAVLHALTGRDFGCIFV